MAFLQSFDPSSGQLLGAVPTTPVEAIPDLYLRARAAQKQWAALTVKKRAHYLSNLQEVFLDEADTLITLLSRETGKAPFEALSNEVLSSLELIQFFIKKGPRALSDQRISLRLMKHRTSTLARWPLGLIAVISPWNYPLLLPMGEIVMGLIAGNAVAFKPSEVTPLTGVKIASMIAAAGFPKDIFQLMIGDATVGAAMVRSRPDKIFFTGSVGTGKKIMRAAAENLTPLSLELGGKDAMIVCADANLDFATSAALWGGFGNSGQVCASVERAIVHRSVVEEFNSRLAQKIRSLRQGPTSGNRDHELGPTTFKEQARIYDRHLKEAHSANARFLIGGALSADHKYMQPTLVSGPVGRETEVESLSIYREETFGPVIAVTTFETTDEAIAKVNASEYGLLASIITRDLKAGRAIAQKLEAGTVTINEVTYTAGLPETPWGGIKNSGFGKKHSAEGLLEFVYTRHIHQPRFSWLVFKSFWWFPYSPIQYLMFRRFLETYRKSVIKKLSAYPVVLAAMARFVLKEKRL